MWFVILYKYIELLKLLKLITKFGVNCIIYLIQILTNKYLRVLNSVQIALTKTRKFIHFCVRKIIIRIYKQ